jgi:hypothetical protein
VTTLIALSAYGGPLYAAPVSSISQYGITWTFDKAYEAGQFATGDWWVVGPVNVTAVTPAPASGRNGSSVNPRGGRQGYDNRGGEYDTADNVTFPRTLAADQSLVSSVSKPEGVDVKNAGALKAQGVLTVVTAPPVEGTLRPAYAGTYKRYFAVSRVDWTILPKLPAPSSKPNGANLLRYADRPHIDHLSSWTIQNSCAEDNWINGVGHPCYGRDYADFISQAATYVMLDTPERNELALSLIQLGIDNYGVIKAGGNYAPNGGHHSGRKWPVVFAARMLNDCDMLRVGTEFDADTFGEDGHTYYGANSTALFGWECGGGHGTYLQNGCSGSGAKDCRDPAGMVDACPDYRNCCTSSVWVGQMLSALMIGGKSIWNHNPFFDYVDRWMDGGVSGGGSAAGAFVEQMWTLYRDALPQSPPLPATCGGTGTGGTGGAGGSAGSGTGGSGNGGSGAGGSGTGGSGAAGGAGGDSGSGSGATGGSGTAGSGATSGGNGGAQGGAGATSGAGVSGSRSGNANPGADDGGGCGCKLVATDKPSAALLFGLGLGVGAALRKRRRKAARNVKPS